MGSRRAKLEAAGLTAVTALAFLGSIALVLPGGDPGPAPEGAEAGWIEAWTVAGCEVEVAEAEPDPLVLETWSRAGLEGAPHGVSFVHPEFGVVARALVDSAGDVLVYEAGRQARLLHPAIGTADLREHGDFYVSSHGSPIERRRRD